jgi:hypothetical protein
MGCLGRRALRWAAEVAVATGDGDSHGRCWCHTQCGAPLRAGRATAQARPPRRPASLTGACNSHALTVQDFAWLLLVEILVASSSWHSMSDSGQRATRV